MIHDRWRRQITHLDVARDLGALEVIGHLLGLLKIPLEEQHDGGGVDGSDLLALIRRTAQILAMAAQGLENAGGG